MTWLRTEGPSHGVDPSFIAVTGGSAGGHLAALLALQPPGGRRSGVEQFVHAAVPLYGIFDLLNRHGTRDNWPIVAALMRSSPAENEAGYRLASPLDQVGPHAPPFFVLHGESDSLISRGEPENFVDALRATSANPVAYALLPGANHSFDLVYSLRTRHVVNGIHAFLEAMRFNGAEPARADQRAEGDNVPDVGGRPGG